MQIYSVWITRKGMSDVTPELIEAWDEFSIEENYDGWATAYEEAVASIGSDLDQARVIALDVSQAGILAAFSAADVTAEVSGVVDAPTEAGQS